METAYKGKFPVSLKKESIFEHQYKDKLRNRIIITMDTKFTIEPSHAKKARMTFDVIMRKTLIKITSFFARRLLKMCMNTNVQRKSLVDLRTM